MGVSIERATLYEKYRLPYASQAVNDLLEYIGPIQVMADIGAGNGQLTRLFAGRCSQVYAVEPEPAMRFEGRIQGDGETAGGRRSAGSRDGDSIGNYNQPACLRGGLGCDQPPGGLQNVKLTHIDGSLGN